MTRDRAVTLGALGALVGLSWVTLARAPHHSHAMGTPAMATASLASSPPMAEERPAAAPEDAEEDDVPRFP